MLPMKAVRLLLGSLLAADTSSLAPAISANKMMLFVNNIAITEDLAVGDLVPANFTGYAPILGSTGAQEVGLLPQTLAQAITLDTPVGGWRWVTADLVNLPQTIYGYALTNNAGSTLLAVGLLDTPIQLNSAGVIVDLGTVNLTFVAQPLS